MGHSPISQPFTASQARFIGRCSVGGRIHRAPVPIGNLAALSPARSCFMGHHAAHTRLHHPPTLTGSPTAAVLPQARFIGRCSVGGRLYRPPFRGSRPISTAPIYRQFHHPLFPARRPAPIVPTSWRLYRAPVPILRQFAVVLSQARFIGRCSVGGRLYRPPFPARQPTPISPTPWQLDHLPFPIGRRLTVVPSQARFIGRCSVGERCMAATGHRPPIPAVPVCTTREMW